MLSLLFGQPLDNFGYFLVEHLVTLVVTNELIFEQLLWRNLIWTVTRQYVSKLFRIKYYYNAETTY